VGSKGYSGGAYQLKVVPITSVTEVIEVIGYQLPHGALPEANVAPTAARSR